MDPKTVPLAQVTSWTSTAQDDAESSGAAVELAAGNERTGLPTLGVTLHRTRRGRDAILRIGFPVEIVRAIYRMILLHFVVSNDCPIADTARRIARITNACDRRARIEILARDCKLNAKLLARHDPENCDYCMRLLVWRLDEFDRRNR